MPPVGCSYGVVTLDIVSLDRPPQVALDSPQHTEANLPTIAVSSSRLLLLRPLAVYHYEY